MKNRKPDGIINAWGSGYLTEAIPPFQSAKQEAALNVQHSPYWRILYRIRVYLKKDSKK